MLSVKFIIRTALTWEAISTPCHPDITRACHVGWDDDDELFVESKNTKSRAETSVITAIDLDTVTTA